MEALIERIREAEQASDECAALYNDACERAHEVSEEARHAYLRAYAACVSVYVRLCVERRERMDA